MSKDQEKNPSMDAEAEKSSAEEDVAKYVRDHTSVIKHTVSSEPPDSD